MELVRKYSSRRGDVFFAYEIVGTSLVVKVFDVESLHNFSITVDMEDKSPQSPKAFFMSKSYWGEFFERYGIAKRTGKSEIVGIFKNNVANEYLFDLSKMTPIKNINEKISFLNVPIIFPKKDSNQSGTRNRWGLTESQTKEALQGVHHSDEVEEAIEWYKIDHNIN